MLILFRQDILTGSTETAAKGLAVTCHGQGLGFRQVQEKARQGLKGVVVQQAQAQGGLESKDH